ncbi:hypothetical protein BJY01DRAFT_197986 [Aspergillus pseudoustus]|uniref:Uncharacterized protein n=1 Tax=Aspergillus pseudoustus TaxID=1810923 RepID=A0ABR4JSV2_9EURO
MAGYPGAKPAFTFKVSIGAPIAIGSAARSTPLQVVPMLGGSFQSAEGFDLPIDAEFVGVGNDYIHADADGGRLRLNAHGVIKTKDEALIYLNYTGIVTLTDAETAVFTGTASEGSTPWGNSFIHVTFETGHERYKDLENRVFVGQGRFNVGADKKVTVEYHVGQVVHG